MDITAKEFSGSQAQMDHIAALHLSIRQWQEHIGQNRFTDILASQNDLQNIDSYYIEPGGNFFVAFDSANNIAGFIGVRRIGMSQGEIKRFAVLPEFHRQGIGTKLTRAAIDWARANDFDELTLLTNVGEKAKTIYERNGFVVTGFVERSQDYEMTLRIRVPSTESLQSVEQAA